MNIVLYSQSKPKCNGRKTISAPVAENGARVVYLLDRPIAFQRAFVTITGSITAALLLSQAIYWQRRCKNPDGWWYKTRDDWAEETGMRRCEQESARRKLRSLGVLQEKLRGVPAKLWYRVNEHVLFSLLQRREDPESDNLPVTEDTPDQPVENPPSSWLKTGQQVGWKLASQLAENQPTVPFNTQTTTEITTTTTTAAASEPAAVPDNESDCCGCEQKSLKSHELIFDFNLMGFSLDEKSRAAKALEGLDFDVAQQVLDEFNEALGNKSIRKSRWAWLRRVAQAAREGSFEPTADLNKRRRQQDRATAAQPPASKPSSAWKACQESFLRNGIAPAEYYTYIAPIRGREDHQALWLEAPNSIVVDWVRAHLPEIEPIIRLHTALPLQVCIG